jgi:hypothetical protein
MKSGCLSFIFSLLFFSSQAQCLVQITGYQPSCFGYCDGAATAYASGNAPFTYQWNTNPVQTTQTATGLCAGTYSVVVVN